MEEFLVWLSDLEWRRLVPETIGKFLGFLLGFAASWFLLFRRRLKALERLRQGDSDDVLYQAHFLYPSRDAEQVTLLFRNLTPTLTLDTLYHNVAARDVVRKLREATTLRDPILQTAGTEGFEVLNDAFNHIAGHLAITPFPREPWLFAMTCEDRQVVRRRCIRCFLIRPEDLEPFTDWEWCRTRVRCERPWHWYRIVALHQIALAFIEEHRRLRQAPHDPAALPLVDDQMQHPRIRSVSLGINRNEFPVGTPFPISWERQEAELRKLGLTLACSDKSAAGADKTKSPAPQPQPQPHS